MSKKDIKTKDIIKDIKSIDKALVAGERIRNVTAKTKNHIEESIEPQHATPHDYATSKVTSNVEHFANKSAIEAKIQSQKIFRYAKEKRKSKKHNKGEMNAATTDSVAEVPDIKSDKVSKIKSRESVEKNIKTTDYKSKKMLEKVDGKKVKVSKRSGKAFKETSKVSVKTSQDVARQAAMQSAKVSKGSFHSIKEIGHRTFSAFNKTFNIARKAVAGIHTAIAFLCSMGWIAILIILLIALIGGIFMSGSSSSGTGNQLSSEVIAYTPVIQKYADEYEIPRFVNALQAIMMQESGGKDNDPMQASECAFNTEYPNTPNAITDPEYSIKVGVQNFADSLKRAECNDPLNISLLSLALQGYNYGNGYIEWAIKNFGAYSQGNAKVFADEQARKLGWNSYGDPVYVPHVMRYYQFAGLGTSNSNLVNIASSQLGNEGGAPYWSWYGYKERVEWCACFVSWVAYQSGDLDVSIPKFAAVVDGVKWYKDRGLWQSKNYVPKEGTIIFFDWESDGTPDHVGIVEKVENGIIYTIEGNSNDQCKRNTYAIGNSVIHGYGILLL